MTDLRLPIGIFFVLLGGMLLLQPHARAAVDSGPVNLYSAPVMLIFGAVMLVLAARRRAR